jgi:hypothetical protein
MIFLNDERSRSKLSTTTIYISFFDTNLKVLWSNFPEILSFFMSLPFLKILQFTSELFNNSSLLFNKIFLRIIGALLKFRYLKNAVFSLLNILFWIDGKLYFFVNSSFMILISLV